MTTAQELLDEASKKQPAQRKRLDWRGMSNTRRVIIALVIIALMLLMSIAAALAVFAASIDQNVSINSTQLPYTISYDLNLTLQENQTIFLNRLDNESRINMTFPASVFLNGTNNASIKLNTTILQHNITGNESLGAVINISNDLNNISALWVLNASILYVPSAPVFNTTYELRIVNNDYFINITSNLLPFEGKFPFNITGAPNTTLNVSCSQGYLQCSNQTFDANGYAIFNITYRIPISQSSGVLNYTVNFTNGNQSKTINIIITISEPTIDMLSYVFRDDCFVQVPGQNYTTVKFECIQEQEEFNLRRLAQFLERLKALQNASQYCQPEIKTEYVVAGQIDKDIYDELTTCRQERSVATAQLTSTADLLDRLQQNLTDTNSKLYANDSRALQEAFEYKKAAEKRSEDLRVYYNKRFWKWVGIQWGLTILLIGITIWYWNFRREKWGHFG